MTSPFQPGQSHGGTPGTPTPGRGGPAALPTPPKGWPIGSYPTYAEAQRAVRRFDPVEALNVAQAHQAGRAHQTLAQHGHERRPTRDDPSVLAVFPQDRERLVDRSRRAIVEAVHARLRSAAVRIDSRIL